MPNPDDAALLSKIHAGDQRSFTMLYEKYSHRLYAYCYRLLQDRQVSEEIVQTTFVKAFESLDTLDKPELFYAWLFSIARNEVYGYIRQKRKNGKAHSLDDENDVWDTESPLTRLERKETSELVLDVLNQLKPEYREVLFLRQYDKLSYAEIAAITGDSLSSVESRLFKARKALATKLTPYFKE